MDIDIDMDTFFFFYGRQPQKQYFLFLSSCFDAEGRKQARSGTASQSAVSFHLAAPVLLFLSTRPLPFFLHGRVRILLATCDPSDVVFHQGHASSRYRTMV